MERAELIRRLRGFAGAALVERDGVCFLVDPGWGEVERAQWAALAERRPETGDGARGWLCIPTGGSSGAMKLARHDERTLGAAVRGFCEHFGVSRVDALGLLPAWHVSGLMAWARCVWTGGEHRAASWKAVERGEARPEGRAGFLSLVPTQLARLLGDRDAEAWLRGFRAVFLGGGPSWPDLLARARAARVPVALSYGMTETAAMVAAQRPEEFAEGDESCGRALPHARVAVSAEGRVLVGGVSLFCGYWPEVAAPGGGWLTDDLGEIDAEGRLRVAGRADALVISGGEKINPAEVEAALREAGAAWLDDVVVLGLPHPVWGREVVAVYPCGGDAGGVGAPADGGRFASAGWRAELARRLALAKHPKRYLACPAAEWPRDARGKINRARLAEWAASSVAAAGGPGRSMDRGGAGGDAGAPGRAGA